MTTFVDASARLALLDGNDRRHAEARTVWERPLEQAESLVCASLEAIRRLGLTNVFAFE